MVTPHSKNQVPVIEGPSSRKAVIVFEGDLGALPLGEVVQMGCVGRQRFWIEVWSDGQQKGSIVLDGGEVVGASSEHHQGDEAFFALARVPHGRFRVYPASDIDRRALPPTSRSWHELLLETARLSDEDGRLRLRKTTRPASVSAPWRRKNWAPGGLQRTCRSRGWC